MILSRTKKSILKAWQENKQKLKLKRKLEEEEFKLSLSTSTKFWNKFTLILVSPRRPWTSWTLSFMIPLTELLLKDPNLLDSTREELFHPEKFNQLSSSSSPENLLDMLYLKEPKPSPNTSNNDQIPSSISQILHFLHYIHYHSFINTILD